MDAGRERPQFGDGGVGLRGRSVEQLARLLVRAAPRHPQRQQHAHEPLLRAVVQIPPEPPPLGVRGLDDAGA